MAETPAPPRCTCLSISRDPLCVFHGDTDKRAPPAPPDPPCSNCGCEERDHRGILTCRCPAPPDPPADLDSEMVRLLKRHPSREDIIKTYRTGAGWNVSGLVDALATERATIARLQEKANAYLAEYVARPHGTVSSDSLFAAKLATILMVGSPEVKA